MRTKSVAIFFLLFTLAAFAQTDRGTITGTITDPASAVIPNAQVQARNVETGGVYNTVSSSTGNYSLSQLPAGNYEMTVAVTGFKTFVRQNLTVQVASTIRIDIPMAVGTTSESVTVSTEATLLKTESGDLSHNVSTEKLNNLPAMTLGNAGVVGNIRNPLQVLTLMPGAGFATDNTLRVNGMPSSTQSVRLDGQDATNGLHRMVTQVNQASLDAIEEVSVQVSNYAAEFGQAGGGYFNYTTKSGSNSFHGGAYDYFVNEAFHAGTPFTARPAPRANEHLRNAQRRNDYGFTFGGPIWLGKLYDGHNKSFFFFNFEQFRENQTVTTGTATVPTLAYRNGDFSGAQLARLTIAGQPASDSEGNPLFQNGVYDPNSQRLGPDGSTIRTQYTGNIMNATDLDKVAQKIQSYLPLPRGANAAAAINNYEIPAYNNFRHTSIPGFKADHNFSASIKMSAYYSETRTYSPQANGFTQPFTSAFPQDTVSRTSRVNYDQTITPTMLLHLGAGLLHTNQPLLTPEFDQTQLGWAGNFNSSNLFPWLSLGNDAAKGGFSPAIGQAFLYTYAKDIKPTFNANLTWVRGNHTIKMGGEMIFEGVPVDSRSRTNGNIGFAAQQSGDPWEDGRGTNAFTGFSYASFLLGRTTSVQHGDHANGRLGSHAMGFYIQDTWKVTRKLTLDYGLRYDYVTLMREQYGRLQSAAYNLPNPVASNRNGTVIYEATCNCHFNSNYPNAWGPRLGAAYQINTKTVFRAGAGLAYGTAPSLANIFNSVGDFYSIATPGYGEPATLLKDGDPYAPGNRFGNKPITWPDFNPNYPYPNPGGLVPPTSPFFAIDRHSGRPPRIFQWSIGLQREISPNLVVEAAYVGNRGVWWTAPLLNTEGYNSLRPEFLKSTYGLDMSVAGDRTLLNQRINSSSVLARFPNFANSDAVYRGFPPTQSLNQALRPYPQWVGVAPFLGPPLGVTWYDSLQAKVTKRFSHGLSVDSAFTWQKELSLGANSDTSYLTPAPTLINDVYNRNQNKQISSFSRPFMLVVSFNYTTPIISASSASMKAVSWAARDWTFGGVLRYQSGQVIRVPASNNGFFTQLHRFQNPAVFGGGNTFWNKNPGVDPLLFDPNCKCFDPTTQLVLNPAAFTDAPAGTFGTAAPYYNDYRWQRQPSESFSMGRNFVMNRERNVNLQVRMEFQNVLNRLFLANPLAVAVSSAPFAAPVPSPATTTTCFGVAGACTAANGLGTKALSGGYGLVNTFAPAGGAALPRTGQMVVRLTF